MPIEDWQTFAACRGLDPAIFFTPDDDATGQARAVCSICTVRSACLAAALQRGEKFGVWGGTTEAQRRIRTRSATRSGSGSPRRAPAAASRT